MGSQFMDFYGFQDFYGISMEIIGKSIAFGISDLGFQASASLLLTTWQADRLADEIQINFENFKAGCKSKYSTCHFI